MRDAITFTLDQLGGWRPCWDEDKILALAGARTEFTLREVLTHPGIKAVNKVWVACHAMPPREARLFRADCALRCLVRERAAGREPDPRSWNAVRVTHDFALGKASEADLRVAAAASCAASCAAADSAADSAADASYAARKAERAKQVRRLIGLLDWGEAQ